MTSPLFRNVKMRGDGNEMVRAYMGLFEPTGLILPRKLIESRSLFESVALVNWYCLLSDSGPLIAKSYPVDCLAFINNKQ